MSASIVAPSVSVHIVSCWASEIHMAPDLRCLGLRCAPLPSSRACPPTGEDAQLESQPLTLLSTPSSSTCAVGPLRINPAIPSPSSS